MEQSYEAVGPSQRQAASEAENSSWQLSCIPYFFFFFFWPRQLWLSRFGFWQPHICELHAQTVNCLASLPGEPIPPAAGGGTLCGGKGERSFPASRSYAQGHYPAKVITQPRCPSLAGSQTVPAWDVPFCEGKQPYGTLTRVSQICCSRKGHPR